MYVCIVFTPKILLMAGSISFHRLQLIVQSYKTLVPGTLDASRGIKKDWEHCQPPHEKVFLGDFFSKGEAILPQKNLKPS